MRALANSEDPDEMPHNSLFAKAKQSSEKYIYNFYLEIRTCDPLLRLLYQTRRRSPSVY